MQPLAERSRPLTLDDYVGQKHLVGENSILRLMIDSEISLIYWGLRCGKTTLAKIIAISSNVRFTRLAL